MSLGQSIVNYKFKAQPLRVCVRCKRKQLLQRHHITYDPEKLTWLCFFCHAAITLVNKYAALAQGAALSNQRRLQLWEEFLAGFPKRTDA